MKESCRGDMLEIKNVYKSFKNKAILNGINVTVNDNESLVILGKSGEGKSVLFKTILGLIPIDKGDIKVSGISVNDVSMHCEYISKFSMLFQNSALFDSMTIADNIIFKLIEKGIDRNIAYREAEKTLERVGLNKAVMSLYPSELSGGMQKRAALARAIIQKPEIILFDEPTSGLDPITGAMIIKLIKNVVKDLKITSMTITHDINAANYISDKIAVLKDGKICWYGTKSEFKTSDDELVKSFILSSQL